MNTTEQPKTREPIKIINREQKIPEVSRERIEEAFRIGDTLYPPCSYELFFRPGDFFHQAVDPLQGVFLYHYSPKEK